ncbi:MAG: putative membrane protein [Phormidesmis priestleyi Ana]|uniref:Putative membrane protein n=1 Tax=Phormidesmis priestleyi Ana TaxID=1666911 RepID=A0A0P8BN47_9CYAN|nr:MAG: putative membrane protein [Phormidesmis priestleyi Ana]
MILRSALADVLTAFSNVYSGWILWNLFLAAVPLFLSFLLFRRNELSKTKVWGAFALMTAVGVVGLWPRLPRIMQAQMRIMGALSTGDRTVQMKLGWWVLLMGISLAMSIFLFKREKSRRTILWWISLVAFIAFLPNAPYVLTDIVHLIRGISSGVLRVWVVALVFIPLHAIAIILSFEAYTLSIINLAAYLKQKGSEQFILPTELLLHALSAIGIYLGRFVRLNSWDLATDPTSVLVTTLNTLTTKRPATVVFVTFIILAVLYWVMKQITLGIKLRIHYSKQGVDALDL